MVVVSHTTIDANASIIKSWKERKDMEKGKDGWKQNAEREYNALNLYFSKH